MSLSERVHHLRQPEYTGENRCIPCTVVNLVIAVVVSGLVALVSPPVAVVVFVVAVAAIYLRGYLVPRTPTLTKRYLPDSVLKLFDKHELPDPPTVEDDADPGPDLDPGPDFDAGTHGFGRPVLRNRLGRDWQWFGIGAGIRR